MFTLRRKNAKLLLALLAMLAVSLLFGAARRLSVRSAARYREESTLRLSHPSGFYSADIALRIEGGGRYDIRYTLDGSEPRADSPLYRPGSVISITDVSPGENVHSARTDLSAGFHAPLLETYCSRTPPYTVSDEPVDKCTVLRAAVFDGGKRIGESVQGVYFILPGRESEYEGLYTVSVSADPEDLFGYERGIMVTGKTFDDYFASQQLSDAEHRSQWWASYWWWWPANYRNTGVDWERSAHITVLNEARQTELDQSCGIRIQGGGSRGRALRSLRCFARPKYAGADTFAVDWFGSGVQPDTFILFSGADDYGFNLQDYLVQSLADGLNIATMDFIPCAFFLNGEFWGLYHITEDYSASYLADHYAVAEDNVILVKNGQVEAGAEYQLDLFTSMQEFITHADMSAAENYRRACELIDMESYIDYYALQTYVARYNDWPSGNYAAWRCAETEASPFGDGKWRWMLFDLNSGALAGEHYNRSGEDSLQYVLDSDGVFRSLFANSEFRQRFAQRLQYMADTVFEPRRCADFIAAYRSLSAPLLRDTNKRIYNDGREESLAVYCENLSRFFAERPAAIAEQLRRHLGEE